MYGKNRGFTLLEVVVALVLTGIVLSIVIALMNDVNEGLRDTERQESTPNLLSAVAQLEFEFQQTVCVSPIPYGVALKLSNGQLVTIRTTASGIYRQLNGGGTDFLFRNTRFANFSIEGPVCYLHFYDTKKRYYRLPFYAGSADKKVIGC
ncbi:MAG: prepilin-type N-terminal cleavage/methylation domain-containing protein [Bacilli bacterium]